MYKQHEIEFFNIFLDTVLVREELPWRDAEVKDVKTLQERILVLSFDTAVLQKSSADGSCKMATARYRMLAHFLTPCRRGSWTVGMQSSKMSRQSMLECSPSGGKSC